MDTVAIIGGGASGMLAALTAAENRNRHVLLLEKQERVGRKLMATGNGRCNLTNTFAEVKNYHGEDAAFVSCAMEYFSPIETEEYFRSLGLLCSEQYGGRVFPVSDSAGSVLDVLRFALDSAGVEVRTGIQIEKASLKKDGFHLISGNEVIRAEKLIVACGGKAGGKLGGCPDGYEILKSFGHRCSKLYPALVPIRTDTDYPRSLKGVRTDAAVRLFAGNKLIAESSGELQFVEKGISGPAAFDISRAASVCGGRLEIDFLKETSLEDIKLLLIRRRHLSPEKENSSVFVGMLHNRLGMTIVKYASLRPSGRIGELTDSDISRLASAAKEFSLNVTGTDSFESAQVTAGGVLTCDFNSRTLESRLVPGLYACGEVLDIDGDCGGYNLQWAWASGRLAGRLMK